MNHEVVKHILVVNGSNLSITLALNFEIGRVIVVAVVRSQDGLI